MKGTEGVWSAYETAADRYLKRDVFRGTPLSGKQLSQAARQTYARTGRIIPLELVLAQAQFETSMGRMGRNPAMNPFNVGEFDEGTQWTYGTPEEGIQAYYDLIANDYLDKDRTLEDLTANFVNRKGNRYASDKEYEKKISGQIQFIRKYLGLGK